MTPCTAAYTPEGWAIIIAAATSAVLAALGGIGTLVLNVLTVRQGRQLDRQDAKFDAHQDGLARHLHKQDQTLERVETQTNGGFAELSAKNALLSDTVRRLRQADSRPKTSRPTKRRTGTGK